MAFVRMLFFFSSASYAGYASTSALSSAPWWTRIAALIFGTSSGLGAPP